MTYLVTDIKGIGPSTAEILKEAGFDTVEKIAVSIAEDIAAVKGFGLAMAEKIIEEAKLLTEEERAEFQIVDLKDETILSDDDEPIFSENEAENKKAKKNKEKKMAEKKKVKKAEKETKVKKKDEKVKDKKAVKKAENKKTDKKADKKKSEKKDKKKEVKKDKKKDSKKKK